MKATILGALLALSSLSSAAASIDGVYHCDSSTGRASYMTVNSHPDGNAVFTIPAEGPYAMNWGYGVGTVTATQFSGITSEQLRFSYGVVNGNITSGYVQMRINGTVVSVNGTCSRVW